MSAGAKRRSRLNCPFHHNPVVHFSLPPQGVAVENRPGLNRFPRASIRAARHSLRLLPSFDARNFRGHSRRQKRKSTHSRRSSPYSAASWFVFGPLQLSVEYSETIGYAFLYPFDGSISNLVSSVVVPIVIILIALGVGFLLGRETKGKLPALVRGDKSRGADNPGRQAGNGQLPNDGLPLTDEEIVMELLQREGGQLKQVHVVEMTDWSKAKVSRVLSRMEQAGDITRVQIGRENLVYLWHRVPKAVQSPFDD